MKQAKRVRLKKEIWPYPKGTVMVSYCGQHEGLYYAENSKQGPTGRGMPVIEWFASRGEEYYEEYFEEIDPVDFVDTEWADRLREIMRKSREGIQGNITQVENEMKKKIKELKKQLDTLEQEYVDHFGVHPDSEVINCSDDTPVKGETFETFNWFGDTGTGSTSSW